MPSDLTSLIATLPIGVYVCDAPDGRIRLYNQRAAELWGCEPGPGDDQQAFASGRLFRLDGSAIPPSESPMAQVLLSGGRRTDELQIERPDGSRIIVLVTATSIHDADGRVTGAVSAFEDVSARKATEEALRLSEARYRAMVEGQPEMVCRFLEDGTLTFANQAYRRFFGLEDEHLAGKRPPPAVPPDDLPRVQAAVASLGPANPVVAVENRVHRADGEVRWTLWVNHAVLDDQGRTVEFQATGRDITEQRRVEEDAARLAAIVVGADDPIVSQTLDGVITSWNRGAETMFGYSAAEAVGRPITSIIPPDRLDEEREILERLERGEAIRHFETERTARDGRRIPVSLTVSPVRDGQGSIIGASKILRDMSERRRFEADLRSTVDNLEVLYRLAAAIGRAGGRREVCQAGIDALMSVARADRASVLVFDEAGVMRFTCWVGLSDTYRAAVEGHSPWVAHQVEPEPILVEDVASDQSLGALRKVITAEGIRSLGFIPLVYQGRLLGKFMLYYDTPHAFSPDELRLAATVARHVAFGLSRVSTEEAVSDLLRRERNARQEADAGRAEALRANRAKDEFLAMLAHELRNPLGVIVNAISVIDASPALEPAMRRAATMVRRQAGHLARLLDDLLDVARITSGRIELERDPVDLRIAVGHAVDAQRHHLEAKRQSLTVELPEGGATVLGDPVRLQQVLGNLVNNASKYTPAGGAVSIRLEVEGPEVVLRIRDTGQGIARDNLDSIFELFSQANPTLARTEGGLGVGLTLARQIVQLHAGTVTAESEGLGRGAQFTVRLPFAGEAAAATERPAPIASVTRRKVLVIEDHDDGREIVATVLEAYGHEVVQAASGREGVDLAIQCSPDVALVDIGLPDIDGYEVARELRRRLGGSVQIVALTGYGQPQDRTRAGEAGFDHHLIKPIEPAKLIETIERLSHVPPA